LNTFSVKERLVEVSIEGKASPFPAAYFTFKDLLSGLMQCTSHSECHKTAACVSKPLRVVTSCINKKVVLGTLPGKEMMMMIMYELETAGT
jgi:hypothetical protein